MRPWLALSLVLLVLGTAHVSRAQSLEQQARVLFREGNELFAKGDYTAALERYRKAKALHPSYKIDLNIGTTLAALGRHTEAAEHYDLFLRRADKVAPRDLVREVATSLDDLRRKVGSVEVVCTVHGAAINIDGRSVGVTPLSRPIYLLPGSHRVIVTKLGHAPYEVTVIVGASEQKRLTVDLRSILAAVPEAAAPPASLPAPPSDDARRRRSKTIWGYSALGASLACAVGAAALYGIGKSRGDTAHEKYAAATDLDEIARYRGDVESAKTLLIGGHVLVGISAAALVVSIIQLATRPRVEQPSVGLGSTVGGATLEVQGRF